VSFLDDMNRHHEDSKAKSHQVFVAKVVKRVCTFFQLSPGTFADDPEFGFGWFHENYPGFPIIMGARNIKIDVDQMFKAMTRSPAWTALMEFMAETDSDRVGLVVPAYGQGLFVAHNWWQIPEVPGHTRLVRRATREKDGIIFEPLESFLQGVKQNGWAP
jgi:hypothetical protein